MYSMTLIPRRLKCVVKTHFYNNAINWIIMLLKHKKGGNLIYAVREKGNIYIILVSV